MFRNEMEQIRDLFTESSLCHVELDRTLSWFYFRTQKKHSSRTCTTPLNDSDDVVNR